MAATGISVWLADQLLDAALDGVTFTSDTTLYVALFTTNTGNLRTNTTADIVEQSGTTYARLAVGSSTGNTFAAAASGVTSNEQDWDFPEAGADWDSVIYVAIMNSSTGGEFLFWGKVGTIDTPASGETVRFATGDLTITMT